MFHSAEIALVTASLAAFFKTALETSGCATALGGEVAITHGTLGSATVGGDGHRLNLALLSITPSPQVPISPGRSLFHGQTGASTPQTPTLLTYGLTAKSPSELGREFLLGHALRFVQETPMLERNALKAALSTPLSSCLVHVDVATWLEQTERLQITLQSMPLHELALLFTAAQTPLQPGLVIQVRRVEG